MHIGVGKAGDHVSTGLGVPIFRNSMLSISQDQLIFGDINHHALTQETER